LTPTLTLLALQVLRVSLLDIQSRSTGALLGGLVYADTFIQVGIPCTAPFGR
jgi:hypothetical protein